MKSVMRHPVRSRSGDVQDAFSFWCTSGQYRRGIFWLSVLGCTMLGCGVHPRYSADLSGAWSAAAAFGDVFFFFFFFVV